MTTTMPISGKLYEQERYMQLIAEGFSDKECAMKMHVKQSILVQEYLPEILRKAGLSTREEIVKCTQSAQEEKGVKPEALNSAIKGPQMAQARAFYRALEQHFFQDDCPGCKSYFQYAVLLVKGQFYKHMEMFAPPTQNAFELLVSLEKTELIHIQKNDELYRVTFVHLLPKEEGHGDNNI